MKLTITSQKLVITTTTFLPSAVHRCLHYYNAGVKHYQSGLVTHQIYFCTQNTEVQMSVAELHLTFHSTQTSHSLDTEWCVLCAYAE